MNQASSDRPATASRALSALGVRGGETTIVGWVAALFFVTQASHGLGANTADALFFLRFGVEFLPLMILISGFVVMVATLAYAAGLSSVGPARWLWPVPVAFAAWLGLERIGVAAGVTGIYPIVWQSAQVVMMVTFTLMWNAAGEVCTTRQAKRLFPLFASAGIAGGIFGNAITGPAASILGTENLLIVQGGLLVVSGWLMLTISRRFLAGEIEEETVSVISDLRAGLEITVRTPLLRLVAAAAVALSVLFFLVAFPFSEVVAQSFDTEAEIAGYLGIFSSLATAATFVVSLLIANRLFSRFGVVATLLIVPAVYVAGFSLWLVAFGLVTASLVRGAQWVAVNALGGTAWSSLFNVLSGRRRGQVMAFITAVPWQIGTALSGVLLIIGTELPDQVRLVISLAVAVTALLLVVRMRPAYGAALVSAVRKGLVDVFTATTAGLQKPDLDADALRALESGLHDERAARRRVAATMLGRLGHERAIPTLRELLADPDASVRIAALDALIEADAPEVNRQAESLLTDPEPLVRLRAARHLLESEGGPLPSVSELLRDDDPRVRATAALIMGGAEADAVVAALLRNADPLAITAGLDAVAAGSGPTEVDLHQFASHPDRQVRTSAATAIAGTPGSAGTLRSLLDDVSPLVRASAAGALAVDPEGVDVLLEVLETGSVRGSEAALSGLTRSGITTELGEWVEGELQRATLLYRYRRSIADGAADEVSATRRYLSRVLAERQRRLEGWILQALGTTGSAQQMSTVRRGAWSDDIEMRAQALEALESIADREIARRLIPLLEGELTGPGVESRTALRELTEDFDPWLRALSVRCLSEELLADISRVQTAAETDDSGLVRSAAPRLQTTLAGRTGRLEILDRVLALQQVPLFSRLDPEELQLIAEVTFEERYAAGEVIYESGAAGDEMLAIIEGSVDVRAGPRGHVIATRTIGEHVGELAVLRRMPRMADVVAGPDGATGLGVRGVDLRSILDERPEVAMAMLGTLAERISAISFSRTSAER